MSRVYYGFHLSDDWRNCSVPQTLSVIFKSGFSRIPVFAKDYNDVIGLLFTKDLIFIDPDDETPLKNFVQIFGRAVTVRERARAACSVQTPG